MHFLSIHFNLQAPPTHPKPTRFGLVPILVLVQLHPHILLEGGPLRSVFLDVFHQVRGVTVETDKIVCALHILDFLRGKRR